MSTPNLTAITATVCSLVGIAPPQGADAAPLAPVLDAAKLAGCLGSVERTLLYLPDAIGKHLQSDHAAEFSAFTDHAPAAVEMRSMFPSFTPVCFASMFTGLEPGGHGIQAYEKPVLSCDTLFAALTRAGKKVALVALHDSSMGTIFSGSGAEFKAGPPKHAGAVELGDQFVRYLEQYDAQALWRGLKLIEQDEFDAVVVYQMQYDDLLHITGPLSTESLLAFRLHLASFARLARAARAKWRGRAHALAVLPDHGAHWSEEAQMGVHGTDMPADMELVHYWGVYGG